ncbi:hypothetical protein [Tenacibaculum ovolyticum]|uniref:hypothetical protein n=1 Tax=Tenacibaculum ovolyticum TaxID=104270 RepID=UPI00040558B8|nr:hypothetical protein [Tenacibaculum ovolyticum]
MKIFFKTFGILALIVLQFSCSSVETLSSWKKDKSLDLKNKNIIVFSKTEDNLVRRQFEESLVNRLNDNGVHSIESYKSFPVIDENKKLSVIEENKLAKKIKSKGVDIVVLTMLKEVQEYTKSVESSAEYSVRSYPVYFYNRYSGNFYIDYVNNYYQTKPARIENFEVKKYILETVVFDLTEKEDKQLISVIISEIDNPKNLRTISKDFSKEIVKLLID